MSKIAKKWDEAVKALDVVLKESCDVNVAGQARFSGPLEEP